MDILRRDFCIGLAALPASIPAFAQSLTASPDPVRKNNMNSARRIDVHHHFLPPEYVSIIGATAIGFPAPNRMVPPWSVASAIEAMDRNDIASAVLSISSPGVLLQDARATQRLARASNQFAAQMVADHPGRFGSFASLPLPDVPASLEEIDHAYDVLHADGIGLMTNYADRYLGDPAFIPVFDALNRRKAVVFVHPNECNCSLGLLPDQPASMIEFPHDTTRAVTSLLFSGTLSRCPDIKFIFCHAGGTLPFLAERIEGISRVDQRLAKVAPQGAKAELSKLYYDTAASVYPATFATLLKLVSAKNILLGTDFPFVPPPILSANLAALHQVGLSTDELRAIERDNAIGLFARLVRS